MNNCEAIYKNLCNSHIKGNDWTSWIKRTRNWLVMINHSIYMITPAQ